MDLDEIKRNVNLIDYANTHWVLKIDSKGRGSCPFHPPDNHSSFSIWKDDDGTWRFKCFHEDITGTIIDLKATLEKISEEEAIRELLKEFDSGKPKSEKIIKKLTMGKATKWIEPEIERSHIYKDRDGTPIHQKVRYKENPEGEKWAIKYWTGSSWEFGKGKHEFIPYNLDKFKDHKSVIICEGEKDADTVDALGLDLLATSAPTGKSNWPDSSTKYFRPFKQAFFFYDVGNDEDVKKHAEKLLASFPDMKIYIAKVLGEKKESDISDYLEGENDKQMAFLDIQKHAERFEFRKEQVKKPGPILTNLDSIEPKPVEWLWYNRIPLGKLTLIVGDPGIGKSFLTIFVAAHVTTGKAWPDTKIQVTKGSVIILTAEDGLADTVRIRADAADADVAKIRILEGIIRKDGDRGFFNLKEHLPDLEQAIDETRDARLVVIDPVTAYLGEVDGHKNTEVRGVLAPLATLAEKYKTAIVCITHLNKSTALQAIYRIMGSLAFIAAARSVWAVSADEDDVARGRRFFAPLKTNLLINPTSLAFSIVNNRVVFEEHPIEISAEEALSKEKREEASALNHAITWLKQALEDGPVAAASIFPMAKANSVAEATLRRAKEKLKAISYKEGIAQNGKWFWKLS